MDAQLNRSVALIEHGSGNPVLRRRWQKPCDFDPQRTTQSNDWYGSREILLSYAGISISESDHGPSLPGRYQHGWQFGTGVDGELSATVGVYLQYRWPIWIWNNRNLTKAANAGMRTRMIGSPVLYLPDEPDPGPSGNAVLAIPMHSSPPWQIRAGWDEYARSVADLAAGRPITVLLHFRDYAAQRETFEKRSVRAVCLGDENAPQFLVRFRRLVRDHALVTGDRVCTAAFYAQHFGRPFIVHGSTLEARSDKGEPDPFAGPGGDREYVKRQFPHMLRGEIDAESTAYELGTGNKRSPEEIRDLFGWQ